MPQIPDILTQQTQAGGEFLPFGPASEQVAQTFGFYEAEYAVLRKGVGILFEPWRGLLRLTGQDVKDFLHRLVTQDVRAMRAGDSRRSFLLSEKGRILADLWIHHGDHDTWLDLDAMDLANVQAALEAKRFTEDLILDKVAPAYTSIALHGPGAWRLLQELHPDKLPPLLQTPGTHHVIELGDTRVTLYQHDQVGALGLHVWVPTSAAATVYHQLTQAVGGIVPETLVPRSSTPAGSPPKSTLQGRAVGWLAFNTARIEAGTPLFHIDFGPDCLPHETNLLSQTTSFTKGCYVGQEIVARMQNLGHPKRMLVSWRGEDDRLPIAGAAVHENSVADPASQPSTAPIPGNIIGVVTSSTVSPLLGNVAIGLAMMRFGNHQPGTRVLLPAEGQWVHATLQAWPQIHS